LGITLWAPVEKLFLKHIGFTAATVGLLAATYAAIVPFLEIPSGILADRWSRRGVLMISNAALGASELVGGLSTNVPMYLISALLLGVYFALHSGTVDSIVYDVLLEETGTSDGFERFLGRVQVGESAALVVSALAGAAIAQLWSPRATYFLTIPFVIVSIIVVGRLREPQLHRAEESAPLRHQVATTYRTFIDARQLRPIIVSLVLTGVLLQMLVEFGPFWMVALGAPAVLFGPQWASLMSALGLGGLVAGRIPQCGKSLVAVVLAMITSGFVLVSSANAIAVIGAQVVLAVLLVATSTVAMRQLHDHVPSSHRAGVSSGVGTLTWMGFLPVSLVFGLLTQKVGIHTSALVILGLIVLTSAALLRMARREGITTGVRCSDHNVVVGLRIREL
jgi:MFS family permease